MVMWLRSPQNCRICGSADVRIDEVQCAGVLELRECARCGDRSTRRLPPSPRTVQVSAPVGEVASAA